MRLNSRLLLQQLVKSAQLAKSYDQKITISPLACDGFDSIDISSMSIHTVGFIPFCQSGWELFGQIGVAQIKQSVSGIGSEYDLSVGAGMLSFQFNF
jgi:hypothetical protein